MRFPLAVVAILFAAAGLSLPPGATAAALAGADGPHLALVVRGVWILKIMLVAHALIAIVLASSRPPRGEFAPLLALREPRRGPPDFVEQLVVIFLLAIAGWLRLRYLDQQLWFDEIDTLVHYVRKPLGYVLTTFDSQNQHMLYSVLARIAVVAKHVAEGSGAERAALRLPAAIFGVASLWALWNFARLVTDRREALFAVALLALSYHHVWFSQDARGYTGLLFFTLLGSTALLRMLTARETRGWGMAIAYAVSMALAVATHVTALFAVAGHGLLWLALLFASRRRAVGPNRWTPAIAFGLTASLSLLFYALVLPQFGATMAHESTPARATQWKSANWMFTETLSNLARGVPGGWIGLAQGAVILGLGAWAYSRQSLALLALFLLGPLVTLAAIVAMHHNLWPRFFFFGAGFGALILFRGLFTLFDKLAIGPLTTIAPRLPAIAATLLCAASVFSVPRAWEPKQDFEGAIEFVREHAAPGEAVATVEMTNLPYQELYRTGWSEIDSLADLEALETSHSRVWIVYTTPTFLAARQPQIWRRLQDAYREEKVFPGTVGGSEVVVCVRR